MGRTFSWIFLKLKSEWKTMGKSAKYYNEKISVKNPVAAQARRQWFTCGEGWHSSRRVVEEQGQYPQVKTHLMVIRSHDRPSKSNAF